MKKAKIAFWGILIAFVALLAYQNWDFFMSTHGLRVNLLVKDYHTPELQNAVLFLIFFFAGLLISYFFSLLDRFKSKKTIKNLTASLEQNQKMLEALKTEIDALKTNSPSDPMPEATPIIDAEKDPDAS
jgi:hypothetical protein